MRGNKKRMSGDLESLNCVWKVQLLMSVQYRMLWSICSLRCNSLSAHRQRLTSSVKCTFKNGKANTGSFVFADPLLHKNPLEKWLKCPIFQNIGK